MGYIYICLFPSLFGLLTSFFSISWAPVHNSFPHYFHPSIQNTRTPTQTLPTPCIQIFPKETPKTLSKVPKFSSFHNPDSRFAQKSWLILSSSPLPPKFFPNSLLKLHDPEPNCDDLFHLILMKREVSQPKSCSTFYNLRPPPPEKKKKKKKHALGNKQRKKKN